MGSMDDLCIEAETFQELLLSTGRPGIDKLLRFLAETDFYTAPSSTKYHDTEPGGLLHHSLNVYGNLVRLNKVFEGNYPDDTLKIVGLLHDVCKADFYKLSFRNVKHEEILTKEVVTSACTFEQHITYSVIDEGKYDNKKI